MNDLISIVIPIYKTESYLMECLNSVQNQSYINFEVLLINDGSPDNSETICLEFVEKDNRFKYFYKTNGGVSSARNFGLDIAKGRFVVFVDSDDFIDENYLKDFLHNYVDDETLVIQDITKHINGKVKTNRLGFKENTKLNIWQDFSIIIKNSHILEGFPVNKLFLNSIIKNNAIRFNTIVTHKEDELFCLEYYQFIKNILILCNSNYNYIHRISSTTSSLPSFDSELEYLKRYSLLVLFLENKINSIILLEYFKVQFTIRFKYIFYTLNFNSNLDKKFRLDNLKILNNEFSCTYHLVSKTMFQKIDFFLLKLELYNLVDFIIIKRKYMYGK